MARSVGEAAATGLEAGFRMARDVRNDEDRRAERKVADDRQQSEQNFRESEAVQNRMRQQKADERADVDYANAAATADKVSTTSDFASVIAQYGSFDAAPPEVKARLTQQAQQSGSALDAAQSQRRQLVAGQQRQRGADLFSNLQAGRVKLDEVKPADLYMALTTQLNRDPEDLIGKDGQPSKMAQAVGDVTTGIETQNQGMLLRGANVLFAPTLQKGVGSPSPYGGTIIGKEIIGMIPHPQNPGLVSPVVRVYVNNGKEEASGDEIRARRSGMPEGAPSGATGHYDAPITQNRSTDPNDPIKFIDMRQALDHVGQTGVLAEMLSHPEIRAKYDQGKQEAGEDARGYLELFKAQGTAAQPKVTQRKTDLGDRVELEDVNAQGRGVPGSQRTLMKGAPPRAAGLGALGGSLQAVEAYAEENGISNEEAAARLQRMGLIKPGKGGGGGGAGGIGGSGALPKGVTGPDVLKHLSDEDSTIVQGLADGTIKPAEISTKGDRREKMLGLAKRFDPSADFGPNGRLKDVPAPAQKAMLENNTNLQRVERAMRMVGALPLRQGEAADKNATGLKGYLPNQLLNRMDPKGVEARAAIADLGSLVIHDRSGAAVTASEFPRLAPFVPTEKDDAATVQRKLKRFYQVYQEERDALQGTYSSDNGYKTFKVSTGARPNAAPAAAPGAAPAAAPAAASGGAQPAAAPAAAPVRTATNPATGEKLILKDGKWQPM